MACGSTAGPGQRPPAPRPDPVAPCLTWQTPAQRPRSPPDPNLPPATVPGMGRDTQAPLVPDHPARTLRGQVLLPDMHPIEIRRQAKIGAVIHDQAHFPPDAGLQFPRIFQDLPRRFLLIAVLQEPYSGGPQLLRPGKQGCATGKESGIEDGIETRKWGDQSQRIRRIDLAANLSIRGARAPSGKRFSARPLRPLFAPFRG